MIAADREIQRSGSSILVPAVIGAAAVGGLLWWRSRNEQRALDHEARNDNLPTVAPSDAGTPPPMPPGRWVFPMPRWQGREPEVSDGWRNPPFDGTKGRTHRGADIMFRRRFLGELSDLFPPRTKKQPSGHTPNYFMPPDTFVLAAADGDVWSAGWTPTGYSVVISHGAPWATYYTHWISLALAHDMARLRALTGRSHGTIWDRWSKTIEHVRRHLGTEPDGTYRDNAQFWSEQVAHLAHKVDEALHGPPRNANTSERIQWQIRYRGPHDGLDYVTHQLGPDYLSALQAAATSLGFWPPVVSVRRLDGDQWRSA